MNLILKMQDAAGTSLVGGVVKASVSPEGEVLVSQFTGTGIIVLAPEAGMVCSIMSQSGAVLETWTVKEKRDAKDVEGDTAAAHKLRVRARAKRR